MHIGDLKHKIVIQSYIEVENAVGELEPNWADYRTVWAKLEPASGQQYNEAKKLMPELLYKITVRYMPDITNEMQLKYTKNGKDRIFIIKDIINIGENNIMLQIMCYEKVYKDVN